GLGGDRTLAIVGFARNAPADAEAVALLTCRGKPDRLGRLAERQGQNAGGERVERAGMPNLCTGRPLDLRNNAGRGEAFGLVDDEPAVQPPPFPLPLAGEGWGGGRFSRLRHHPL